MYRKNILNTNFLFIWHLCYIGKVSSPHICTNIIRFLKQYKNLATKCHYLFFTKFKNSINVSFNWALEILREKSQQLFLSQILPTMYSKNKKRNIYLDLVLHRFWSFIRIYVIMFKKRIRLKFVSKREEWQEMKEWDMTLWWLELPLYLHQTFKITIQPSSEVYMAYFQSSIAEQYALWIYP